MIHELLKLKAVKIAAAGLLGLSASAVAFADPNTDSDMQNHTPQTQLQIEPMPGPADYFAAADLNGDSALSLDEYTLFVDTLADSGNADMIAVRDKNTYTQGFFDADTDADGLVSYEDLGAVKTDANTPMVIPNMTPDMPDIIPEYVPVPETQVKPKPEL